MGIRLNKLIKDYNVGIDTLIDFLNEQGAGIEGKNPNTKIDDKYLKLIEKKFGEDLKTKKEAAKADIKMKEIIKTTKSQDEEEELDSTLIIKNTALSNKPEPALSVAEEEKVQKKEISTPKQDELVAVEKNVAEKQEAEKLVENKPTEQQVEEPKSVESPELEKQELEKPVPQASDKEQSSSSENSSENKLEQAQHAEVKLEKHPNTPEKRSPNETKDKAKEVKAKDEKSKLKLEHKLRKSTFIKDDEADETSNPGVKILGKVDLSQFESKKSKHKKRERINKSSQKVDINKVDAETDSKKSKDNKKSKFNKKEKIDNNSAKGKKKNRNDRFKPAMTEAEEEELQKEIQKQVKETYARMNDNKKSNFGAKYRKEKRELASQKLQEEQENAAAEKKLLKVTEFVTVNDLAVLMNNTPVNKVIGACLNLGLMVSINQRLDAEALVLVAEEFGYKVEFITAELTQNLSAENEDTDNEEDLVARPPIITVMGHVDHGKTSLLDYIRKANVIAGEAGGITQHIGAYNVVLPSGRKITFLDTPGHEAFTAMRARGAQLTDLAIIIIAADDAVMPQTVEAINHAQAAGVPMIFAINKIDKPGANSDRIYQQLSQMNILTEAWGGKYQCQELSAKQGTNVDKLLDKVLLETDMMELKANPKRAGVGAVIESSLDKGRGYVTTVLVQNGTVRKGDMMLCGQYFGRVKAMLNERGVSVEEAGPATPVSILGLNGAPSAGEKFNIMADEKEAKSIANKREQLIRIQGIKTQKHMTLEEIGRRIAIGNFKELNVIVKGDVDGSVEALSDSLIKLSTEEIHVNVIHKAVGAISESDIMLATASDAIIIGFQVRPSSEARNLAEKEGIEIRLYSIIYDAINEVKDGIEGMLEPEKKEEITATAVVKQIFKISKVGTIAGCFIKEGKMNKNSKVRLIRDGIVVYTGDLSSLKRGKDDVKEVSSGMECGIGIENYNDIKDQDVIEAFTIVEIKRKL